MDKETGAQTEIKATSGEEKEDGRRKVNVRKKKVEAVRKSLRLTKLRNMETPEPISRNHAADIGGGRPRGICKYFSSTHTENRGPLLPPRLAFRASTSSPSLSYIAASPSLFSFPSRDAFLLSIARFSRHFFSFSSSRFLSSRV